MKPVCRLEPRPNEWSMLENTQLACPLNANQHAVPAFVLAGPGEHLTGWKRSSPPPPSAFLLSSFPSPLGISWLCLSLFLLGLLDHQHDQLLEVQYSLQACVPESGISRLVLTEVVHGESATGSESHVPLCAPSHVSVSHFHGEKSLRCFQSGGPNFVVVLVVVVESFVSNWHLSQTQLPYTSLYPCQN